ncbi:MAG: carbohydrate kinase family protein [Lachnospiraceae bacterium]
MSKILCIGQSVLDITVPLDGPIQQNVKYQILDEFRCGGGPAFNSAYVCGKWKAPTSFLTQIGGDENGKYLKEVLKKGKVDLDYIVENPEMKTPYSYIFTNSQTGDRTLFNFPGKVEPVAFDFLEEEIAVILSDGHEPELSVQAIRKYPNAISIVDAGGYRECTMTVAREVDYLVCSEYFASQHTGKEIDPNDWETCLEVFAEVEKINGRHVVITLGDKGLLYKENGEVKHLPAFKVKAVDTTGAGDIFHGAFAYGIFQGMPYVDILKMSSMASAIACETLGGNPSIPELSVVQKRLEAAAKGE